ncbi:hypothetical protein [Photobacterium iliopiscarium]|uniref:hypothetical protein n=1 Tax=Photobacterium iliopiscarium TaxID=56192 RepID=UPI001E355D5E|nr:hypothetical protein [Photobacterium iliopiscarium]MCD9466083.1 hypothetical protein [Photobacterium iliopiscarium]MCD9486481.1 hypothetical protein [Photobacterium iliopiscarium]MCF2243160.1 hypothetical protein [Photobacterium iliopiscarium]
MFFVSQHQRLDQQQNNNNNGIAFFDRELPNKMLLHSTFIYENEGYFQCVWEAENREILLQYINKIVGGEYQTDCYGIDPFTAIS